MHHLTRIPVGGGVSLGSELLSANVNTGNVYCKAPSCVSQGQYEKCRLAPGSFRMGKCAFSVRAMGG